MLRRQKEVVECKLVLTEPATLASAGDRVGQTHVLSAMYERFTDRARKVMQLANEEAERLGCKYIGAEHVLVGLVREGSGVAAVVLKNLGLDLHKIRTEVESLSASDPPPALRLKNVIEYSMAEARNLNHGYIGTEHILLGVLREPAGAGGEVITRLGLSRESVRSEVLALLGCSED